MVALDANPDRGTLGGKVPRQSHASVRDLLDVTPAADGLFDLVFSVNTVHHLRDHERVLPHLRGLVAPGGSVLVIDITDPGGWATLDYQVRDAFRDAEESYRERSRDHRIAAKVLELHLHPLWLELSPADCCTWSRGSIRR